jgi:hypothetical protein
MVVDSETYPAAASAIDNRSLAGLDPSQINDVVTVLSDRVDALQSIPLPGDLMDPSSIASQVADLVQRYQYAQSDATNDDSADFNRDTADAVLDAESVQSWLSLMKQ